MPAPGKSNLEILRQMRENKGNGDFKFWKPKEDGKYTIRFLPPISDDKAFYEETAQYKLGDKYFYAPHVKKMPDPIYDYYLSLWKKKTPEAEALAREIKPRKQFIYNIVVKDECGKPTDNPTKVYTYMSGIQLNKTVCDYMFDADYGDLTDIENGYDFILTKTTVDKFPNYDNSKPRKNPSRLFDDPDMIEETVKQMKDLSKEIEYKTYDELKAELDAFIKARESGDSPIASASTSAPATSRPAAKTNAEAAADMSEYEKGLLAQLED
jgi:hypothetical protein